MAEKEGIDLNDSKPSEVSPLEELDLNDQIEILPVEKDTVELLEVMQEEVAGEEAENESGKPDSDTFHELEVLSSPDDGESELPPKQTAAEKSRSRIVFRKPSGTQITVGLTSLVLFIVGAVIYATPSLIGFKREAQPAPLKATEPTPPVQTVQKQVESAKPLSKSEIYLIKVKEADLFRDELLEKKEEIHQLKHHYQNGIADLEELINRELQKEGITSYTEALKNRRIELSLRTIQRRRSYIHGLEKPTRWIEQGSEELLYLKRKAEFDLQLVDIAGGIDMDRHMRHIGAAIQKYRLSAEKLAVDRENTDLQPLETIWGQIKNQKMKTGKALPNVADEEISKEICAGNYERIAELTGMSASTAQCLSKMNGPDLFLNGLTTLSPAAAKYLFQWRGSWICINGIKELSPATAQYLFKWEGNWISLNGLIEFPPELAAYLMDWEGKQLELMGLGYNKKNTDQKALKYLALWETMGGKLFISDDIRKEIERVMM